MIHGKITTDDLSPLLQSLAPNSWAAKQVRAALVLEDGEVSCRDKMGLLLDLAADWAILKLIAVTPLEDLQETRRLIGDSSRPRSARAALDHGTLHRLNSQRPDT